ncbi:Cytochrome P450 3A11 [Colletotrichum tanaceti]|uniref:Cytochrome P450 3A11 n=1 Tax=Colletotrichum tanaceti TaxID=1306861 RepID=A0A4U6XUQ8_9PEZI|nr:Cytochrome P450 3A11 [Colletotrichum tanaceti]KAJ0167804.1 Cytochrome P450 3A11 [Colletotrichum tanaceti]TKW59747.1 Cytochrome P450 3A11 [Colletotrichum tanaceti]
MLQLGVLQFPDTTQRSAGLVIAAISVALYALYRYLLPKPIAGIPYNLAATQSLLGDLPTMLKESNGTPLRWMADHCQRHSSPLFQLFITPFSKPIVVVSDFREAQDILMRRKEFDRSDRSIVLLGGETPEFHLNMKMGKEWKDHRRLLQDLASPRFLSGVAAPNVYQSATNLVDVWKQKARIANGQPFNAEKDLFFATLDAVLDFGFGDSYPHRSLTPQLELLMASKEQGGAQRSNGPAAAGTPVDFPVARVHESIEATLAVGDLIQDVANSGVVKLAWWFKGFQPRERKLRNMRTEFIRQQADLAVDKLQRESDNDSESWVKSAVDLIVQRERNFAKREGREPVYWSMAMRDEVSGFVVAGHDTTSTTMCWAVKFLADNPQTQTRLRQDLRDAYADALANRRAPTHNEIEKANIPFLDAVIEEILRVGHTVSVLDRQCTQDTVILGHRVPEGTQVILPTFGPDFTSPPIETAEALRSETSQLAAKERGIRSWSVDDMEVFRPERWLKQDEQTGNEAYDATAGPTFPFGLGPRACFGRKLAYLMLKMLVTSIIWNYELLPCAEHLSSYERIEGITSKPRQTYVRLAGVAI